MHYMTWWSMCLRLNINIIINVTSTLKHEHKSTCWLHLCTCISSSPSFPPTPHIKSRPTSSSQPTSLIWLTVLVELTGVSDLTTLFSLWQVCLANTATFWWTGVCTITSVTSTTPLFFEDGMDFNEGCWICNGVWVGGMMGSVPFGRGCWAGGRWVRRLGVEGLGGGFGDVWDDRLLFFMWVGFGNWRVGVIFGGVESFLVGLSWTSWMVGISPRIFWTSGSFYVN